MLEILDVKIIDVFPFDFGLELFDKYQKTDKVLLVELAFFDQFFHLIKINLFKLFGNQPSLRIRDSQKLVTLRVLPRTCFEVLLA
jgi:hypothetical protein